MFSEKMKQNLFPLLFFFLILFNDTCLLNITLRVALVHAELLSKSSKPNLLWLFISINRKR